MEIQLSNQSKKQLLDIFIYTLINWGENQANIYLNSFYIKFDSIATLPRHGRFLFVENGWEFRKILNKRHIIHYVISDSIIFITEIKSQYQL